MSVRLLSVDDVQVTLNKTEPPTLLVVVSGSAATPGYSNIRLDVLEGDLSADRIFDLEFVGDPPTGIVPQLVVPAHANLVITQDVEKIAGVMVHARTNSRTALVGAASFGLTPLHAGAGTALGEKLTTLALGEEGGPTIVHVFGEGSGPVFLEKDIRTEIFRKLPGFEGFDPRDQLGQRGPFGDR